MAFLRSPRLRFCAVSHACNFLRALNARMKCKQRAGELGCIVCITKSEREKKKRHNGDRYIQGITSYSRKGDESLARDLGDNRNRNM